MGRRQSPQAFLLIDGRLRVNRSYVCFENLKTRNIHMELNHISYHSNTLLQLLLLLLVTISEHRERSNKYPLSINIRVFSMPSRVLRNPKPIVLLL